MVKATSLLPEPEPPMPTVDYVIDVHGRAYTTGWRDALYERMPRPLQVAPYYLGYSQASAHLKAGNRRVLWSIIPVIVPEVEPE